ncbi:serine carboxypeptidase-like 10 isoform X3 [Lactuca sativa]|uniref:serine carboxypeptidase-like 10 isoform X3 n=1 Tax=Lactuca sativa TaxID=4236 RepID=UPI0022AF9917|nr:serine carboxypeptidase-like 10 isoform X3 [Lactuca sativa]
MVGLTLDCTSNNTSQPEVVRSSAGTCFILFMAYTSIQFIRSNMKPQSLSYLQQWIRFNNWSSVVFLLLLVFLEVTESQFLVKTLPGLPGDLPFTLETGYIGVGEYDEVQLFYYFVESEGNPKDDPLMLWLTGGPGCSGLSGLLYEIGPFTINYVNSTVENVMLEINPHSWTKAANIIFLDQPAGSGFSYAKTPEAYITNDTLSTVQIYHFLRKWLVDHPTFLKNPLYICADSYSGLVVPMILLEIYNGNEVGEGPQINIKGYVIGNPLADTNGDYNSRIPFAHRMALLSDAIYNSTKETCHGEYLNVDPNNTRCVHDLQVVDKFLEGICMPHILEPVCDTSNALKFHLFKTDLRSLDKTSADVPRLQKQWCRDDNYVYSSIWANRRDVQEALHIPEVCSSQRVLLLIFNLIIYDTFHGHQELNGIEWVRCNETLVFSTDTEPISYTHNVISAVSYHRKLIDKHCRALVYSGDHDMVIPYMATINWIESLNLLIVNDWRPFFVDEQVAGYTMKYSNKNYNLTYATVKGGGHTAPEYKPKECLSMLMRWLDNGIL